MTKTTVSGNDQFYSHWQWSSLQSLAMTKSTVSGNDQVSSLWQWPSLQSLAMTKSSVTGNDQVYSLWRWQSLQSLAMTKSTVSGDDKVYSLWQWPSLQSLAMTKSTVHDQVYSLWPSLRCVILFLYWIAMHLNEWHWLPCISMNWNVLRINLREYLWLCLGSGAIQPETSTTAYS